MSLWEPIEKFPESYESKVARAHKNIVVVALANKLARIAWAVLAYGGRFDAAHTVKA